MHDPALHHMVHKLMKKVACCRFFVFLAIYLVCFQVFMQLLAEFKRMGARVIFASFTKLLIATNKTSLVHAQAYMQYSRNVSLLGC